ncbi:helix-turn-helix domain-containing protein [Bacillus cereus group sp. BfR-BA-01423]|jgi:transcriptional regulator with XRE-family HTH domain|uniref:helix-turn-helix domain-containing protein n=1 Tax=Bacillus cereus group sp. BfR-BA-01423 TaxID=2920340 RepID=UPI001F5796B5|nr:helix-turn-helix transcriptional regulator [Bacillus cereus group sp. BfR-BA-01423]HEF5705396.1 helix-turn-helix transcriptional regulator [Bacillus paranthracis]
MFPARLREVRKKKDLTQQELAEMINKDRCTISNYEIGDSKPTIYVLSDLATALGVSTDYLLGRVEVD